ncbi:DUF4395 domain-containing protein [Rhodoferax sp.]|uniref:DUF4395 domain-containing protein n=1 Tax=Rhodoferax sp. TaxID=50421 RepID=UPI0027186139|nr:DUF4395 domain-containing protein [Rhodoferax sp.]MDO9144353.1 DUF4395 domain-containing protein [Rhodoferax sp.]MDP1531634.1 DUF4395 domain-containing protein [Rhodoferax sp.]MDP1944191.1 DUF4395 domain-containing protein [Rhodoferax sp.]MDP2441155.1 DUF4395 domain-containing protein [Rhodoferax sp.]MDP3192462.1 DUF4395 domain-containing protein [Rhodoferax sp.]
MTNSIFQFGEKLPGYAVPVLNERAVRASAGILFFFAIVSFMNAWLMGNFQPTRVFVVAFLLDFTIRIFINPRYAPSLIVGQWLVRAQVPDPVGAPQKRFAWAIGFVLALSMLYLVVLNNVVGPINLLVCALCLMLLFFEAAFGICLGCRIYNMFNREKARLCPGSGCEMPAGHASRTSLPQVFVVAVFALVIGGVAHWVYGTETQGPVQAPHASPAAASAPLDLAEIERCKVPDFAKAMGHEEKWKLHNNCK